MPLRSSKIMPGRIYQEIVDAGRETKRHDPM
jgi:hypothetical protein